MKKGTGISKSIVAGLLIVLGTSAAGCSDRPDLPKAAAVSGPSSQAVRDTPSGTGSKPPTDSAALEEAKRRFGH